jgi:transposase
MHISANLFNDDVLQNAQELYKKSASYQIRQRMHFILLKAKGYTQQLIGDILDVTERTTYHWWQIFQEGGLEALADLHYQGQPSKLRAFGEQLMFAFINEPVATFKEARHRIIEKTGIERGLTQVREFMLKHKLLRRKVGQIPDKADVKEQHNFKENKLEKLIALAKDSLIQLLFVDASHFVHQPFLGYLYSLKRIFIRAAAGRKRYNVLGALNAISHQLTTICNESYINAETVCQLLHKIAKEYVNEKIYIILDNARYQRCLLVQQTASMLGITLVFLPPYSPNLNLIERLWRFVKKEVLYCEFYATFIEFKSAIDMCLSKIITKHYKSDLQSLLNLKFQTFET